MFSDSKLKFCRSDTAPGESGEGGKQFPLTMTFVSLGRNLLATSEPAPTSLTPRHATLSPIMDGSRNSVFSAAEPNLEGQRGGGERRTKRMKAAGPIAFMEQQAMLHPNQMTEK